MRFNPQGYVAGDNVKYIFNDGDGSTRYDIDVPVQIHGFDPNVHFVGMAFKPQGFEDMKDRYFLLNGSSYPDTIGVPNSSGPASGNWTGGLTTSCSSPTAVVPNLNPPDPDSCPHAISTADSDTLAGPSPPVPLVIVLSASRGPANVCGQVICGQRAALRIHDLDVTEYQTFSSVGIPMQLVGFNSKILRDQAGNNQYIKTNSITLGGGESLDVIIDSTGVPSGIYFLYAPQLDYLSNDSQNFGGLMTEIVVVP